MYALQSGTAVDSRQGALFNSVPVLIVALGTLLSVMHRNPLLFTDPQMFSEDIFVYFNEDRLFGASAVVEPYSGYLDSSAAGSSPSLSALPPRVMPPPYTRRSS
ncbi:folate-dependent tRNA-U54 methylase TrmFO/GidA [Bradyrhizobium sp. F1.13.4]